MTWYWWTHWFWITSLSATINCYALGSVDTSPSSSPFNHGKIYNKGEPLKFPIAVQSDSDDVIDGKELLEAKFHEEWMTSERRSENLEKNGKDLMEFDKNETLIDIPEVFPLDHIENSSRIIEPVNHTFGSKKYNSSFTKNVDSLQNSIQSNIPITKVSQVNVTTAAPKVEKITKLKSISIKSQSSRPDVYVNKQNESELTTEPEVIREETEKQVISERGRQSKILAEYSQTLKIVNLTLGSKNLLERSANEVDGDDELNSEALTIKRATILDAGAISGICLAVVGLSFIVSAMGVMLYRRRYVNKPQTLSEPDSSGYIDDSTMRDNSDEMYSLDNDSFLNSLEAMTIQNYWTDNVKHTKL
ncbi:uncharacterized protein LOC119083656 [Bradysia coprophila]|uniref:uncharacterized protein LOC119083656 n=1 Tax=Bradysia coprophila TaxID=38358 RepID=UPI00187D98A9|nr:uncharacterized protein LOC119083656 [Bradysia coprophila]